MQRSPLQELTVQNGTILGLNIKQNALVNLDAAQPKTVEFDSSEPVEDSMEDADKPAAPRTPLKPCRQTGKAG